MQPKFLMTVFVVLLTTFVTMAAWADDVEVPTDELAQESVYPVFDNPVAVKSRNVQDSRTIDIGIFGGLALTEPVYNTTKTGVTMNYHISENHSLGIIWAKNSNGLSRDGQGLYEQYGLDFMRAPAPDYAMMADYNYKMFYGKLSLTKDAVMNTSIYFSGSGGIVKYTHKSYPALAIGVGERFYFGSHFSLKMDLRLYAHQAPIPFKKNALKPTDPVPTFESFDERLTNTTNLEIGLNYLF